MPLGEQPIDIGTGLDQTWQHGTLTSTVPTLVIPSLLELLAAHSPSFWGSVLHLLGRQDCHYPMLASFIRLKNSSTSMEARAELIVSPGNDSLVPDLTSLPKAEG